MPHTIKSARPQHTGLIPATKSDRRALLNIVGYIVMSVFAVFGLWLLQEHWYRIRELTWSSAPGTLEDVRPVLALQGFSRGGLFYRIVVLVNYQTQSGQRESWISLRQAPQTLTENQLNAQRWKGATCTVRWSPSDSSKIDADIF